MLNDRTENGVVQCPVASTRHAWKPVKSHDNIGSRGTIKKKPSRHYLIDMTFSKDDDDDGSDHSIERN